MDEDEDEDEDEDKNDEEEAGAGAAGGGSSDSKLKRKRDRAWLEANFIKATKSAGGGIIYKSELLPDKVFFSREQLQEFTEGKRYKRLLHEMKKGMRTHADNEKLRQKAEARRERQSERREARRREKVERRRALPTDEAGIEAAKAKFQAKKARRLERKKQSAAGA